MSSFFKCEMKVRVELTFPFISRNKKVVWSTTSGRKSSRPFKTLQTLHHKTLIWSGMSDSNRQHSHRQ